jgi:hypothetical protein
LQLVCSWARSRAQAAFNWARVASSRGDAALAVSASVERAVAPIFAKQL